MGMIRKGANMDVEESSEEWRQQQRQKQIDGDKSVSNRKLTAKVMKSSSATAGAMTPSLEKNLHDSGSSGNRNLPAGSLRFLKQSVGKPASQKAITTDRASKNNKRVDTSIDQKRSQAQNEENEGDSTFFAEAVSLSSTAQPGAYSGVPGEPLQRIDGLPHPQLGGGEHNTGINDDDDDDDDDDDTNDISNRSSILVGHERVQTAELTIGLVEAQPVVSKSLGLPEASEVDPNQLQQGEKKPDPIYCRKLPLSVLVVFLLGTCLVVIFVVKGRDKVPLESMVPTVSPVPTVAPVPTASPSSIPSVSLSPTISPVSPYCPSVDAATCDIAPILPKHTRQSILAPGSPQSAAHSWVTNDPVLRNYSAARILQRFALATFYYATSGDRWVYDRGWLVNVDECRWYSRKPENYTWNYSPCNSQGMYEHLLQWNNGLSGNIPPELSFLTALKKVNLQNQILQGGGLRGSIPSEIGELSDLEELDISVTGVTGVIPTEIGRLAALTNLQTFGNSLSGFPDSICELPALSPPVVDCVLSSCPMDCDCECFVAPPSDFLGDSTSCCAEGVGHCCSEATSIGEVDLDGGDTEEASVAALFTPGLLLALGVPLLMSYVS